MKIPHEPGPPPWHALPSPPSILQPAWVLPHGTGVPPVTGLQFLFPGLHKWMTTLWPAGEAVCRLGNAQT